MAQSNADTPVAAQLPAANTDAVCTLAADPSNRWLLYAVRWSYSAAPTGGQIVIAWGAVSEVYYVSSGGPGELHWPAGRSFPKNTTVTITLKAGGGTVQSSVYATAHTTP